MEYLGYLYFRIFTRDFSVFSWYTNGYSVKMRKISLLYFCISTRFCSRFPVKFLLNFRLHVLGILWNIWCFFPLDIKWLLIYIIKTCNIWIPETWKRTYFFKDVFINVYQSEIKLYLKFLQFLSTMLIFT